MKLTDAELALLPSDDDVRFFQQHGYYISKRLYSDDEIASALEGADKFYLGETDDLGFVVPEFSKPRAIHPGLRKNDYAALQKREIWDFVSKPLLAAITSKLIGSSEIRLWHDQLLYKPGDADAAEANVGWHTDRGYWKTCTSSSMVTAWVPYHDCDEEMGTITMIDGSIHWPDNADNLNFFSGDLAGLEAKFVTGGNPVVKVPMYLPKGHASFHHCQTIHGSGPNRTARPRRSSAVHMQDASNRWRRYEFPNGTLAGHCNDDIVRKDANGNPDYTDPNVCPVLWTA